jgi:hypothetical protein
MEKRTVALPFNSFMPDSELELFFGKGNIVEIRRTSKVSEVDVYSDHAAEDLMDLLREREDNYHLENRLRTDKSWAKRYRQYEEHLSKIEPCEPITRREHGIIQHGFRYLRDNGDWEQVWLG